MLCIWYFLLENTSTSISTAQNITVWLTFQKFLIPKEKTYFKRNNAIFSSQMCLFNKSFEINKCIDVLYKRDYICIYTELYCVVRQNTFHFIARVSVALWILFILHAYQKTQMVVTKEVMFHTSICTIWEWESI